MTSQSSQTSSYDAIVVGAGIEGSACAYSLVKSGQRVLLLEQFPLPHGRGSSHGHSRITRYIYKEPFYVHMMLDAFPLWAELEKEAGQNFFVPCGVLDLRTSGSEGERQVSRSLTTHNVPHEVLTSSEVRERFPMLTVDDSSGAVWDPSGGLLRADKCLTAFQTVFKRLGGVIRDAEPVTSLSPGDVCTVVTSRGVYKSRQVVIATGAWTGPFVSALDLSLPLMPIRVSALYWKADTSRQELHGTRSQPCIVDSRDNDNRSIHVYSLPIDEYPGLVKVALHHGADIDPNYRDVVDTDWIERVVGDKISQLMPHVDSRRPVQKEYCIYTNTPDNHPFIDRHPRHKNIVICAGFSGSGFKLAPVVGKAVTQLLAGQTPPYDMAPFRLDRFAPKPKL